MRADAATSSTSRTPKRPQQSKRGEYRTVGDIGSLDDDGYLYLSDRKADMIISGGVNIYPAEIESVLITPSAGGRRGGLRHPQQPSGAKRSKRWSSCCLAKATPTTTQVRAELLEFLQGRVARYKLPRSIDFVDALPRDPNGKLYKRRLRDPYWVGQQRAI